MKLVKKLSRMEVEKFLNEYYLDAVASRILKDSEEGPIDLKNYIGVPFELGNGSMWAFKRDLYEVVGSYSDEEFRLLILEEFDKERRHFEKLRTKFYDSNEDEKYPRPRIPESVRIEVWR